MKGYPAGQRPAMRIAHGPSPTSDNVQWLSSAVDKRQGSRHSRRKHRRLKEEVLTWADETIRNAGIDLQLL